MADTLMIAGTVAAGLMVATWLISLPLEDVSIVDIVWGLGFVLIGWTVYLWASDMSYWSLGLLAMVTIWGLRLATHIGLRKRGHDEDYRYQAMRKKNPRAFPWMSFFTVFLLQAILMWVVSLPLQLGISRPPLGGWLPWIGAALWLIGFTFESVGDWQLTRFKANPDHKGKVLDSGLWRFTRHPNYFGDFCVWWGIYIVALAAGHWWTVIGPLVMSALLMRYSGAGLLEKTIGRRRPGYDEYIRRTNAFFPGPPKG